MTEPANTATACVAAVTGSVTICGKFFGMEYDALVLGFFGGVVSLMWLPAMNPLRLCGTLFTASVFGGAASPLAPAIAAKYADFLLATGGAAPLRLFAALAFGAMAQGLIGLAINKLKRAGGPTT